MSNVSHIPEIYKERRLQAASHQEFTKKYGGDVFYIFSIKENRRKVIANPEVVDEIRLEIERLQALFENQ